MKKNQFAKLFLMINILFSPLMYSNEVYAQDQFQPEQAKILNSFLTFDVDWLGISRDSGMGGGLGIRVVPEMLIGSNFHWMTVGDSSISSGYQLLDIFSSYWFLKNNFMAGYFKVSYRIIFPDSNSSNKDTTGIVPAIGFEFAMNGNKVFTYFAEVGAGIGGRLPSNISIGSGANVNVGFRFHLF